MTKKTTKGLKGKSGKPPDIKTTTNTFKITTSLLIILETACAASNPKRDSYSQNNLTMQPPMNLEGAFQLPISVIQDGVDITNKSLACDFNQSSCQIWSQRFNFNSSFVIKLNKNYPKPPKPQKNSLTNSTQNGNITTLYIDTVNFLSPDPTQGLFMINLTGSEIWVEIKQTKIVSATVHISAYGLDSNLNNFNYVMGVFMAEDYIFMTNSVVKNTDNNCMLEDAMGFYLTLIYQSYAPFNCSETFSPYNASYGVRGLIEVSIQTKQSIHLNHDTIVNGNVLFISDYLTISDKSQVNTLTAGCGFNGAPGTPELFISQSFHCGLNGGSYGGRGGVGVSTLDTADTGFESVSVRCLKSSVSRMNVYGDGFSPLGSGATGSAYKQGLSGDNSNIYAPGGILVFTKTLIVDKTSFMAAGYVDDPNDSMDKGSPASSGGSIYLIAKHLTINGKINVNGQNSSSNEIGAGGGGRIFLHNYCWYYNLENKADLTPSYNFSQNRFSANPGTRTLPEVLQKYGPQLSARKGTIFGTPCTKGRSGINCSYCPLGQYKIDYLTQGCEYCPQSSAGKIYNDKTRNNCQSYTCDPEEIQIIRYYNPNCLTTTNLISDFLVSYRSVTLFMYVVLIIVLFISHFKTGEEHKNRKRKKMKKIEVKSYQVKRHFYISLQGKNSSKDPWFMNLEISKDFRSSFFSKGDHFHLTREVNRIVKWSQKQRLMHLMINYFCPPIEDVLCYRVRQKITKKLKSYLKNKNEENRFKTDYKFKLWTSKDLKMGQIFIKHNYLEDYGLQPLYFPISGDCTVSNPLQITVNHDALKTHLKKLAKIEGMEKDDFSYFYHIFKEATNHLNKLFAAMTCNDINTPFVYHTITLIDEIKKVNNEIFSRYFLRGSVFIVENLKHKYQTKNLRFNKMYRIEGKSFEKIIDLKKRLETYLNNRKISAQFIFFLMPLSFNLFLRDEEFGNSLKAPGGAELGIGSSWRKTEGGISQTGESDFVKRFIAAKVKGVTNVSQRLAVIDLSRDDAGFRKLMKASLKARIMLMPGGIVRVLEKQLRTPLVIDLNRIQISLVRFALVTLFFAEWVLMYFFVAIMLYDSNWVFRLFMWMSVILPNFFTPFYVIGTQFLYIVTLHSRELLFLSRMNLLMLINFTIWFCIIAFYAIFTSAPLFFTRVLYPCLILIILIENYLICVLVGDKRERRIANFTS